LQQQCCAKYDIVLENILNRASIWHNLATYSKRPFWQRSCARFYASSIYFWKIGGMMEEPLADINILG
jgi:hypothetical protein